MSYTFTNTHATVILHHNGLAVCEDCFGDLWFSEIPEDYAELGSAIELSVLEDLDTLPTEDQQEIRRLVAALSDEMLEDYRSGLGG